MNKLSKLSLIVLFVLFGVQNVFAVTDLKVNAPPENSVQATSSDKAVVEVTPSSLDKVETKLKTSFAGVYTYVEAYRNKQAIYFQDLRDKTKIKLGIEVSSEIVDRLKPFFEAPPAPVAIPGTEDGDGLYIKEVDNPKDYGLLIFATAMASLFASVLMFYGVLILLIFIVLRTIFKMFG